MSWIKDNISPEIADYLFNIKVILPDRVGVYQKNLKADLMVDFDNLEEELQTSSEMICFFDLLLAEQKSVVAHLEHKIRLTRGTITDSIAEKWKNLNKEIRSTDLKQIIESDEDIIKLQARINKEILVEDKLKAVINGLKIKNDNARSLAGFKKEENKRQ